MKVDPRQARALFEAHQNLVMSYCMISAGQDRDRAKDLTQETFLRAFRSLDQLKDAEKFKPWVMTIARNVCRSSAAAEARRRQLLEDAAVEMSLAVEEDVDRQEQIATVQAVLATLPDDTLKEIVMLKYTDPVHTTRQIAEKLDIPHGTVTVKLMRFRAAIKKRMLRALLEGVAA